jgi:protein-tyrosine-phosphatase
MRRPVITMVCSGNICRSPMACAIARDMIAKLGLDGEVDSAGTLGIVGKPADPHARVALGMLGLEQEEHRSRAIDAAIIQRADALVVMSAEHERSIRLRDPTAAAKIHRLWEYTDESNRLEEIDDPIGGDLEVFLDCRDDLVECLTNWIAETWTRLVRGGDLSADLDENRRDAR